MLVQTLDPENFDEFESVATDLPETGFIEVSEELYLNFLKDLEILVKATIIRYFDGKKMHCGGPIPKSFLHHPDYLTMVSNLDICSGVDRAYEALERAGRFNSTDDPVGEDIKYIVNLLHEVEAIVPRPFVPGIMLMHLELVDGVEI